MKNIDLEVLLGGVFGVIAIMAIFAEMLLNNFDKISVAGGIKDIAGTIVAVMVFIVAAKSLFKKQDDSFNAIFIEKMKAVENKYTPLLRIATDNGDEKRAKKLASIIRYELSTNIDALLNGEAKSYASFFELDMINPTKVTFYVNKTTFMGRTQDSFDSLKDEIKKNIRLGVQIRNNDFGKGFKSTSNGFEIDFGRMLKTEVDAIELVNFIDSVILFYIALCKK